MRQIRVHDIFLMNKIKQDQSYIQRHRSSNKCLKCKYVQQFALEKPLFFFAFYQKLSCCDHIELVFLKDRQIGNTDL